jgi:Histidine kinase-, DNA gyrase B-, and HSP90-like ATPase
MELGSASSVAFFNRLFGASEGGLNIWPDASAMIRDLVDSLKLKAAGLRWPAAGAAYVSAQTEPATGSELQYPVAIPEMTPGIFWAKTASKGSGGSPAEVEAIQYVANAIGHSPAMKRFLGPMGDQARIATRLNDAAKVAGRVAHDFDNVFQGVTGFAALAMELLEPTSQVYQNITEADNAARYGMKFCQQLHQLSRGGTAKPMPSTVGIAFHREMDRARKQFSDVRFDTLVAAELPAVAMEGGGLGMLLGFLLDNAAEADPKTGQVTATAKAVELSAEQVAAYLGCPGPGPHVAISVADRGAGVTPDNVRKMFLEPFFTTKFRHRGLSLTVAFRMLYAHRGGARVESTPGQGTTVTIVLPLASTRSPAVDLRSTGGLTK